MAFFLDVFLGRTIYSLVCLSLFFFFYMSLERLIDLAQRTGDRLVVHDPFNGRDIVLLDVDDYEALLDQRGAPDVSFARKEDIRGLSSDEFIDRINRDIALWRTQKEQEEGTWVQTKDVLERQYPERSLPETDSRASHEETASSMASMASSGSFDEHTSLSPIREEAGAHASNVMFTAPNEPLDDDEPVFLEEPL
ncbi:MAG: hypothetical protein A3G08_04650 [Candidatus Magasanikbacteria bacterium RIFCSPLOWO2_12_FULL_47_9b]|nr:MAG: hypothetical protein A3I74_04035 [Candidatus Magasanikbacteria bacterium RIFCSPLOWO2_02_FULL_47_16]OGH79331.1 MAG: hypothetical protein A3C10_04575 [Candidatus Magasanikbacteria bacterium RIFCSPHIGHO2_02_FULL_48_18]OGH81874.1 MAG: hypothetical protein A3G08_04650 [Candidatus Magasanikbacteria bacterium RIFCSPLOWO2_12_FULL_47_9b]